MSVVFVEPKGGGVGNAAEQVCHFGRSSLLVLGT